MSRRVILKANRTREELHPRTEIASVEGLAENYVHKEEGKGLSTNDFDDTYKNIIIGLVEESDGGFTI